jgi:CDK5 regulatory subunit-associated protein 3
VTANLEKLMSDADKMSSMSRLMATRRGESVEEQQALEPQLDLFRQRTKELQKQVCQMFSIKLVI